MAENLKAPFTLILGDAREVLRTLLENSVDAIVTDPPAGISFTGKDWDGDKGGRDGWIKWLCEIMAEALRVLKPGGHALVWALPRTSHWTGMALEDAGFEIRDCVYHVFGSGFPKSLNIGKAILTWEGWGTGLKPAVECWWLCRKPLSEPTVAKNVLRWGTGAINIDQCRIGVDEVGSRPGNSDGRARRRLEFKMKEFGGRPALGRFPSHLIHDGSPEVLAEFEKAGERSEGHYAGSSPGFQTGPRERDMSRDHYSGDSGSAARFFYCAKASPSERNAGLGRAEKDREKTFASSGLTCVNGEWVETNSTPRPRENHHPTVKPLALMTYLIKLITPPGGLVLDPFMGSGSTGVAAVRQDFRFLGVELNPEYLDIARRRIEKDAPLFNRTPE